ncbi:LLM class flavin-dependent oxidoreductase [Streptomyces canus]|uniref:LLM class flavin-dependent oxidoreductase n=1 Tax=Streptomyces canus TaxID=58343 RepID=UPI0036B8CD6B
MKTNHPLLGAHRFKLGMFCSNLDGGLSANLLPERWKASWENCIELARQADAAGLDVLVPASRWIGWGGDGYQEEGMESIIWAAALAHATKRIALFSTVHVPMFHPILAGKQMAAVDQLLRGRYGLNLVCGWNQQEAGLFGVELHEQGRQYDKAQEWLDIVRAVWRRDGVPLDYKGDFYDLKDIDRVQGPSSYDGDPVIINAAYSARGREFAARNCDFLLTNSSSLEAAPAEVAAVKSNARALGQETGVLSTCHIICRPTRAEAEEYRQHVLDNADNVAVDNQLEQHGLHDPQHFEVASGGGAREGRGKLDEARITQEQYDEVRRRTITGYGSFPIVGSPDDVANDLAAMAEAGYSGAVFGLTNYLEDLPIIRDEVLPRLEAKGLREPADSLAI